MTRLKQLNVLFINHKDIPEDTVNDVEILSGHAPLSYYSIDEFIIQVDDIQEYIDDLHTEIEEKQILEENDLIDYHQIINRLTKFLTDVRSFNPDLVICKIR